MHLAARALAMAGLVLGVAAPAARAQAGNLLAIATVPPAMTVTGVRTLSFGNVLPGVPATVATTAPTSGRFQIGGVGGANVRLTFAFPPNLMNGPNAMPIGSWTACRDNNTNPNNCTAFTPVGGAGTPTVLHPSGTMHIWLGATVSPAGTQVGGFYSGMVTLVASYF